MNPFLLLLLPVFLMLAFAGTVLFWAGLSHIRFLTYFQTHEPRPPALGFGGWTRFYWRTLRGAVLLLWWNFRAAHRDRLQQPPGGATGRPVLCVHGLFLNATSTWGIRRHLESLGRPTRAVFMGLPFPTPMAYVEPLAGAMRELGERFPDTGFDIVAHSIGGVMTREVLRRHPDLADAIGRIITLGSPHHGTATLRWFRFGPIYRLLSPGSRYLEELPDFRQLAPHSEVTTVATLHDLVVYPVTMSLLDGARPVTLSQVSHLGLLTDSLTLTEIERAFSMPPS